MIAPSIQMPSRATGRLSELHALPRWSILASTANLDPKLLSATGYSQYRPLLTEDSDSARARNRRIEVVVVYTLRTNSEMKK